MNWKHEDWKDNLFFFSGQVLTDRRVAQLSKKPLQAVEFVAPLARLDPIYKDEEESFKVGLYIVLFSFLFFLLHLTSSIFSTIQHLIEKKNWIIIILFECFLIFQSLHVLLECAIVWLSITFISFSL